MAEDVKLNISGNMSQLKGQLSKADADIAKTKGKLTTLRGQIVQTESRVSQLKAKFIAGAGATGMQGIAGMAGASLTLGITSAFTPEGSEPSFWATAAPSMAVAAMTLQPWAVVGAGITAGVSWLTNAVTKLAEKQKAIDLLISNQAQLWESLTQQTKDNKRALDKALAKKIEDLEKQSEQKAKVMSENVARQMISQEP